MRRCLPVPAAIALCAILCPPAASARSPLKPAPSIPGALPGDRIIGVGEADGPIYSAAFVDDVLLVGLDRVVRRIAPGGDGAGWQAPAPGRPRVLVSLPAAKGAGPAERSFVIGADDGGVHIHRLADGRLIQRLPGPSLKSVIDIAASADGRDIVAVSLSGRMAWWRDRARRPLRWSPSAAIAVPPAGAVAAPPRPDPSTRGPFDRLEAVAFAPDGRLVLAGRGPDRLALAVLDPETLKVVARHHAPQAAAPNLHWGYGQALAFAPDGRRLALGYWGGGLELLSWPGLGTRWANELGENWVETLRWQGDGRLWVTTAIHLHAVRPADGASARVRSAGPNHVFDAFDLSPGGERAALAPRATGVVLIVPTKVTGDWQPPRFGPPPAPAAIPLAPGADLPISIRCPRGYDYYDDDCRPIDP